MIRRLLKSGSRFITGVPPWVGLSDDSLRNDLFDSSGGYQESQRQVFGFELTIRPFCEFVGTVIDATIRNRLSREDLRRWSPNQRREAAFSLLPRSTSCAISRSHG
ncbi:hypothetical protein VNO77_02830 [Canavalia gladiata]|uniref:Uncharacterized protein n=1 Tax=Canavalia gladiata TaxID=3824 RepID=A0AAN9R3C7_CANGL